MLTFDWIRLVNWNLDFIRHLLLNGIGLWNFDGVLLEFLHLNWVFLDDFIGLWKRHLNLDWDLFLNGIGNLLDDLVWNGVLLLNCDSLDVLMMMLMLMLVLIVASMVITERW